MWHPKTVSEVQAIIRVSETSQLEFKRELGTNTSEIAKDLAAMTVDGGVIAYGIEEQDTSASSLMPIPLGGVKERIRQIADTSIHPPPALDIEFIEDSPGSNQGFAIVEVPASFLAPHMSNGRYYARSGTTTRHLWELEVARLYEQRRTLANAQGSRTPSRDTYSTRTAPVRCGQVRQSFGSWSRPRRHTDIPAEPACMTHLRRRPRTPPSVTERSWTTPSIRDCSPSQLIGGSNTARLAGKPEPPPATSRSTLNT